MQTAPFIFSYQTLIHLSPTATYLFTIPRSISRIFDFFKHLRYLKGAVRGTTISRGLKKIPPLIEFLLFDICCHTGHGLLLHGGPGPIDALGSQLCLAKVAKNDIFGCFHSFWNQKFPLDVEIQLCPNSYSKMNLLKKYQDKFFNFAPVWEIQRFLEDIFQHL